MYLLYVVQLYEYELTLYQYLFAKVSLQIWTILHPYIIRSNY